MVELYFEDSATKIDTLEARLREPAPNYGQVGATDAAAASQTLPRALLHAGCCIQGLTAYSCCN